MKSELIKWARAAAEHEEDPGFWAAFRDWAEEKELQGVVEGIDWLAAPGLGRTYHPESPRGRRSPRRTISTKDPMAWWFNAGPRDYDPENLVPDWFPMEHIGKMFLGYNAVAQAYEYYFLTWLKRKKDVPFG